MCIGDPNITAMRVFNSPPTSEAQTRTRILQAAQSYLLLKDLMVQLPAT